MGALPLLLADDGFVGAGSPGEQCALKGAQMTFTPNTKRLKTSTKEVLGAGVKQE